MANTQEPFQSEAPALEARDEFASGPENRLRAGVRRLVGWFFGPPYFPSGLIWLLMALIATNSAIELLAQPPAYWVDFSTSWNYTFLGTQLKWGLWAIAAYGGYMIVVALVFAMITQKPAFILWIGLSVYHLVDITQSFRCRALFFPFENPNNCAAVHTASILFAGILSGLLLIAAAWQGLISGIAPAGPQTVPASTGTRSLRTVSITLIALLGLAVCLRAVFAPKPAWQAVQAAHVPSARTEAALAYDTKRSVAVLFGGTPHWTLSGVWESIGDTWEWNGQDWAELQPEHSPSPRFGAGMAFDEQRGVTVLFGGMVQVSAYEKNFLGDTWEWDGQDWQEMFPAASPPGRQDQAMFFDPLRGRVVIYGGYYVDPDTGSNVFLDDAWEWNGETWRQIPFEETRINSGSGIVYDPFRQLPMLMDGEGLWVWQQSSWTQPNFPATPPARWGTQMVYNSQAEKVILFGGSIDQTIFDDTWAYDGQTWQPVVTKVRPPRRSGHNLFYDQMRGRVLLFGGLDGGTLYNDMWELVQP